ncbi:MAG: RNA polymerase sigma factor [Bacteroidota bacterium]
MTFIKLGKSKDTELEDNEVVRRIVEENQQDLLEILYERYVNRIYRKCLTLTREASLAKDLTHDIMVKVLLNLAKFKGNANFSLWVNVIAYNYCMDYFRKQKKKPISNYEVLPQSEALSDYAEIELRELKELQLTELEEQFGHLRKEDQMILLMRYQDGMSIKEMASLLGIKEGAVKMRLKRSRAQLSKRLKVKKS